MFSFENKIQIINFLFLSVVSNLSKAIVLNSVTVFYCKIEAMPEHKTVTLSVVLWHYFNFTVTMVERGNLADATIVVLSLLKRGLM